MKSAPCGGVVSTHGCASPSLLPLPQTPEIGGLNHVRYRDRLAQGYPFCLFGGPPGHGFGIPEHSQHPGRSPPTHRLGSHHRRQGSGRGVRHVRPPSRGRRYGRWSGHPGGSTPVDRPGPAPWPYPDQNRPGRRLGDRQGRSSETTRSPRRRFGRTPKTCVCWSHTAGSW